MHLNSHSQKILRSITWTMLLAFLFALIVVQMIPVEPESHRWLLNSVLVVSAGAGYIALRFVLPRRPEQTRLIGLLGAAYIFAIALCDYLIELMDLTPMYMLVIIIASTIANWRVAFFIAASASASQLAVNAALGRSAEWGAGGPLRVVVYFASAFLVSYLVRALTERWRAAAAHAELERQAAESRKRELEGLYEIAQSFDNLEDACTTFSQLSARVAKLLQAQICILLRYDDTRSSVQGLSPGYGLSEAEILSISLAIDREMDAVWDIRARDYLCLNDLTQMPARLREYVERFGLRQIVAARMVRRAKPTGVIIAANRLEGEFTEADARLLCLLAGQASIAVENAQLYREAQTTLQDITRLYAISTELAAQSDPDEIPRRVIDALTKALGAPIATIALLNEQTNLLEYTATLGVPVEALKIPFRENGLGMTVVRTGQARFIEDIQLEPNAHPVTKTWGYRGVACLPIQRGDKPLGALYVNYAEPHTFSATEQNILATFANQTAVALENARLRRAEQRQAMQVAALANLSHSLAETMDLPTLFRVIEQRLRTSLPAAQKGALLIYDARRGVLTPRAFFGYRDDPFRKLALRPGESIAGQVFASGQTLLIRGTATIDTLRGSMQPDNRAALQDASDADWVAQCIVCAPVRSSGGTLGIITLESAASREAFTLEDAHFLEALSDRAALAIRNAQLYADGLRRAAQLETMAEIARRVTSILELDELLPTIVNLLHSRFGYRYVHLFINAADQPVTICRAGAGAIDDAPARNALSIPFGYGIIGWVAEKGERLIANDVSQEPRFAPHAAVPGTRAEIALPLQVGTRLIGVLDAQSETVNAFDPSDVAALETLAGQVAIAIENARLYGEVQEQARRDSLTQVYNHGYFLQRLVEEVERARQTQSPLSLIMLDIDLFKDYNDAYGHVVGDQVLEWIVRAICAHVKKTDLVGRWGGEEFGIALLETDVGGARLVAQRIRDTVANIQLAKKDGTPIPPPTVSQGIAAFPLPASDSAALIDLADAALYHAKARGRDQVCVSGAQT